MARLDAELLSAVSERLGLLAHFSGRHVSPRDVSRLSTATCPIVAQLSAPPDAAEHRRLIDVDRSVQRLVRSGPGMAPSLRIRALWTLYTESSPDGRDRAVRFFQAALAREPESAERKNDLAAALLLRAGLDRQPEDLASALEILDPLMDERQPAPAVLFNRAYALQCLTLWDAAQATLSRLPDGLPEVVKPAQAEAAPLASPTQTDPLVLRRRGEWLLGEWAVQSLHRDVKTSEDLLHQAGEIGSRLQAGGGDRLLSSAVAAIRQTQQSDSARLLLLQRGHADFHAVRGTEIYSECRPEVLARAEAALAAAASPFAGWVRLDQAVCAYFEKDFRRAESLLTALRQDAITSGFLALQGRAEWILGLIRMVQARFVEADRHYGTAIDLFTRLGEDAGVVYLRSLRAKGYEFGGAIAEAWQERLSALVGRQVVTDPERLYTIFEEAAQAMHRRGHHAAALGFLSEQMRAAEMRLAENGDGDLLAFTLIARADLLAETGRSSESAVDLSRAQDVWKHLPPENESRRRLRVDLDVQLASLSGVGAERTAVKAVDRAIAFFAGTARSLGDQIEILRLRQLRAKIHLRQGELVEARNDLRNGISEVERQRLEVAEMEDRARFLTAERGLFMDLLRLELDHFHDHAAALEVLERSSNRVFGDLATAHTDLARILPPSHWAEILKASLPSGTLIIRYGHLSDRLLIWTFLDGRMDFEERIVAEAELRSRVARCRRFLVARSAAHAEREEVCNDAASILLPRSLPSLPEGHSVLIVADEVLSALPLGALRAYPGGPYLVERYLLAYTPSLESWLMPPAEPPAPQPEIRSALFISDPAFSRNLYPTLKPLEATRRAPGSLASYYPRAERLAGQQATKAAVLASLDRSEVLHFDGHGITNSQYPERGGLLLAPADPTAPDLASSLLTAADLPPRALKNIRLVVLGACSTGLTTYRDTAEVTGLAAAFLAQGVPAVIGTAWDVPNDGTSYLLEQLHRRLAEGERPEKALQEAQRMILHSGSGELDTRAWAAFQVFLHPGKHGTRSV